MDQYAVFGNPIEHSKSPMIHTAFAEQTQQAMEYKKQLVAIDGFKQAARDFFAAGGRGLNITVPFKLEAFEFADVLTERAQQAQAVNTLSLTDQGIEGDNTDGYGLINDITSTLNWPVHNRRVLILGAGGAVRGILHPLLNERPSEVVIANRTLSRAEELASISPLVSASEFETLDGSFDLIINGTSASLAGDLPPMPNSVVNANTQCYDMMYGQNPTVFMRWAMELGAAQVADGLGMLVGQAAESFYRWRGVRPEVAPIIQQVRAKL